MPDREGGPVPGEERSTMKGALLGIATVASLLAAPACEEREYYGDGGFDADTDVDTDADADAHVDVDADTEAIPDTESDEDQEPPCGADGTCDPGCEAGSDPDCEPPDCGADGSCTPACGPGEDPDCGCGTDGEPCCGVTLECGTGLLCADITGPATCRPECEPPVCSYGDRPGYCMPIAAGIGLCAGDSMTPVDCVHGSRGCTTEYGVAASTMCVRGASGDTYCYETCPTGDAGCEPPAVCQHVRGGGACSPL
jgi:hypothetical protein